MLPEARGANNHRNYIKNSYIEYNLSRVEKLVNNDLAEEVGVEPTDHFYSSPLVLKTRRPTGDNALPRSILAGVFRGQAGDPTMV